MPRNLAILPPVVVREAVRVAKVTETDGQERLLAPVEAAHIGLVWRITRRKLSGNWASWVDIDPFEIPSDQGATPQSVRVAEAPSFGAKKLKTAHILDQGDESEFTLADAGHITVWFHTSSRSLTDNQTIEQFIVGVDREGGRPTGFSLRRLRRFDALRAENPPELIVSPLTCLSRTALGWRKKSLVQPIFRLGFIVGGFSVWRAQC